MLTVEKQTSSHEQMLHSVAAYLGKKGFQRIRVDLEDFEKPAKLIRKDSPDEYVPDLTARINNGKCYFEMVTDSVANSEATISKWQLFSTLAEVQNGKFYVLVPHGKMSFTNRILTNHNITAEIIKMQSIM